MLAQERHTSLVHDADLPWANAGAGVAIKVYRVGAHDNTYQMMTRIDPGVQLPRHKHFGEVHTYTVAGSWGYREYDWLATTGTYIYEAPGTTHTYYVPEDSNGPAINFVTLGAGMLMLPDDGDAPSFDNEAAFQDGKTTLALYKACLEGMGLPFPADAIIFD